MRSPGSSACTGPAAWLLARAAELARLLLPPLLLACATPPATEPAGTPVPHQLLAPEVDRSLLSPIERRGFDLYVRNTAAARAKYAARAALAGQARARVDIAGWIIVPYEQGFLTRFITRDGHSAVDVSVDPSSALAPYVVANEPGHVLPMREAAMWRAHQLAVQQPIMRCSDQYNIVVLPESDRDDSDWLVYLIAVPMKPTQFVVGGHHRFRINPEGSEILEHFALSRSCMSPEYDPNAAGFAMTHLVSSEPVETQVYLSLLHGIHLFVSIPDSKQLWSIENGRVQRVED